MASVLDTSINDIPDDKVGNAILYRLAMALGHEARIGTDGILYVEVDCEQLVQEAEVAIAFTREQL